MKTIMQILFPTTALVGRAEELTAIIETTCPTDYQENQKQDALIELATKDHCDENADFVSGCCPMCRECWNLPIEVEGE